MAAFPLVTEQIAKRWGETQNRKSHKPDSLIIEPRLPVMFGLISKSNSVVYDAEMLQVRCLAASEGAVWGGAGSSVVVWGAAGEDEELRITIHRICSSSELSTLTLRMVRLHIPHHSPQSTKAAVWTLWTGRLGWLARPALSQGEPARGGRARPPCDSQDLPP
jgi:hypothetical protein